MADSSQFSSPLTLVLAYRDRNLERVARCLGSLAQQTFTEFRVLFVDYGSSAVPAVEVQRAVAPYPFCAYVRTETQGRPWNRAHALNIGIRQVTGGYVMTSDVDMVFAPDLFRRLVDEVANGRMLYVAPRYLPKGFTDWARLVDYQDRLPLGTQDAKGGCQVAAADVLQQMRGFDEYYQYWGIEDRDLYSRLRELGLETVWLSDQAVMFHQWHPPTDIKTPGYIPEGVWGRMENHYYSNCHNVARNGEDWGRIHTVADRPVFGFLDFAQRRLAAREDLTALRLRVDQPREISRLVRVFWELPSGHALAVYGAFQPQMTPVVSRLIGGVNRGLRAVRQQAQLAYRANPLHSYLAEMLEDNAEQIADYYLNFPVEDGVSLLVKK